MRSDPLTRCLLRAREAADRAGEDTVKCTWTRPVHASLRAERRLVDFTLDYCAGFFQTSGSAPQEGPADVFITHDPTLLSALADLGNQGWRSEGLWERWPYVSEDTALVRVNAAEGPTHFFVDCGADRVTMALERTNPGAEMATMRTLRSVLLRRVERKGLPFLHAAGVAGDRGCVLIAGARFGGKTTALLRLMLRGYDLLSNDKVSIEVSADNRVTAQGYPIAAGVRIGTLTTVPGASTLLSAARSSLSPNALANARNLPPSELHHSDEKVRFSPARLAAACGVGVAPRSEIEAVIVSRFDPATRARIEPLNVAAAADHLRAMRLERLAEISPEHAFLSHLGKDAQMIPNEEVLAQRAPVFLVTQNASSGDEVVNLVRRFLGDPPRRNQRDGAAVRPAESLTAEGGGGPIPMRTKDRTGRVSSRKES